MIKFFRHIRQRLVNENRFSKYMLYAIGEIILVVIGILIALWINNLNIDNQQQKERDDLVSDLKEELSENLDEFNERRSRLIDANKNLIRVLNFSAHSDAELSLDSIKQYVTTTLTFNSSVVNISRLSSAKSSGKFNLLSGELSNSFTVYETLINNYGKFLDITNLDFRGRWSELVIKFGALKEFHDYSYPDIAIKTHPNLDLSDQEITQYLREPDTYQLLHTYYMTAMVEAAWLDNLIRQIESTLNRIDEEQK
jgi:hypothetical protein